VQFGISPFGVWRNKSVDPRDRILKGQTNYDDLFADPMAWMQDNYIDYIYHNCIGVSTTALHLCQVNQVVG
jgi:uncharacterized lipoprotein YddW (UPF0748 family)